MVIDTSALLAILYPQPDAGHYVETEPAAERRLISDTTSPKTVIVVDNHAGLVAGSTPRSNGHGSSGCCVLVKLACDYDHLRLVLRDVYSMC